MNITEKEYSCLLSRIEAAELEAKRAKAVNDVQNIASKFFWYHANFRDDLIIFEGLWAKKAPDIHAEYGQSGVYKGYENVIKFNQGRPCPAGKMLFHAIDTPVIEVAEDCKTAKGVWLLHGAEGGSVPVGTKGPVLTNAEPYKNTRTWAHWTWAKYAMDFIVEDGEWKLWHFHGYDYCRTSFDMDWVNFMQREADNNTQGDKAGHPIKFGDEKGNLVFMEPADEPPTCTWVYDGLTSKAILEPRPPMPYDTFDDTFSY